MAGRMRDQDDTPALPEVKGGIKARSRQGAFAERWWGKRFVNVVEGLNIRSRILEGRSYARRGLVMRINITAGLIQAEVQGTQTSPHGLKIRLRTLTEEEWKGVSESLAGQLPVVARLLAGEIAESIETVFSGLGLPFFPSMQNDLQFECSCRDWSKPCKHAVAAYDLVGEALDYSPILLFRLRGIEREHLVELIGRAEGVAAGETATSLIPVDLLAEDRVEGLPPEPIAKDPSVFWGERVSLRAAVPAALVPPTPAELPKRLGAFPFWRAEEDFLLALESIYREASPVGRDVLLGEKGSGDKEQ